MASEQQLTDFIARQRVLLQAERDAEIQRSSLILSSCGPKLLELKGLALLGLGVASISIGLGGKSLIELERPSAYHTNPAFPPHTFRPGDIARIEENVTSAKPSAKSSKKTTTIETKSGKTPEGVVYKISDTRVILAVDADSGNDDIDLPERCRLVKLANSVTFDRMDKVMDQLERTVLPETMNSGSAEGSRPPPPITPLVRVLMGISEPSAKIPVPDLKFLDESLNDSQKDAVRFSLEAPELALIHGPPGTGKTHTLVEIIRQLVARDKRVLICGASNLAVDNLLERLVPHNIPLTRVGHPARILSSLHTSTLESQTSRSDELQLANDVKSELESAMSALTGKAKGKRLKGLERKKMWEEVRELRKEYRKREGIVVKSVMGRAKIVLATCHTAGGRQLINSYFDVVIIDEATQAMEAVCWIPILKAKKLILAGDPLQLPPTVISTGHAKRTKTSKPKVNTPAPDSESEEPDESLADAEEVQEDTEDEDDIAPSVEAVTETLAQTSLQKKARPRRIPQLRPPKSLEVTLFDRLERMYGKRIKRMLKVQYRMNEMICQFPSNTLYGSRLISHSSVASHLLNGLPNVSDDPEFNDVVSIPVVFFDTAGCEYYERLDDPEGGGVDSEGSRSNENEAQTVKTWVDRLVEAGVQPSQIAIITPYQAQVTLLGSLLRPSMPELEIGTVDGMQGREKEAVVLSLVRSNDKREVGFLKEKRRLNVAMTRPRRHLCVVGDSSTVSTGSPYLKKWMAWLEENADVRFGGQD